MKFTKIPLKRLTASALLAAANRSRESLQEEQDKKQIKQTILQQENPQQLTSVNEFLEKHLDSSFNKRDVKTILTEDQSTLDLAKKIIDDHSLAENFNQNSHKSLLQMVLEAKDDKSDQKGSIPVKIARIEGSNFESEYDNYKNNKKKTMLCVGGPSAVDQALLASSIPEIAEKTNVVYIGAGNWHSNLVNSALQVHARHGNALNADDSLTGHALLATLAIRGIIGIFSKSSEAFEAAENPDYRKIHIKFTLNPEKLSIYLAN